MSEQPEALRLADAMTRALQQTDDDDDVIFVARWFVEDSRTELRRLHAVNAELLDALKLALSARGVMLMSDPPQEAWKAYGVEQKARAAIAKAEAA